MEDHLKLRLSVPLSWQLLINYNFMNFKTNICSQGVGGTGESTISVVPSGIHFSTQENQDLLNRESEVPRIRIRPLKTKRQE